MASVQQVLQLDINPVGQDTPESLVLTWCIKGPDRFQRLTLPNDPETGATVECIYRLMYEPLLAHSLKIRAELEKLAARNLQDEEERKILLSLAALGQEMRAMLFGGAIPPKYQRGHKAAVATGLWFAENVESAEPGAWKIEVSYKKIQFDPLIWGLIWAGGDVNELSDFRTGFWAVRFGLSCSMKKAVGVKPLRQLTGATISVVAILEDHEVIERYRQSQSGGAPRYVVLQNEFKNKIEDDTESDLFWYVALEPQSSKKHPVLEVTSFNSHIKGFTKLHEANTDDPIDPPPIYFLFLDGDAVIRGDRGQKFLQEIMDVATVGLMAVECDIPDSRKRLLGWSFWRTIAQKAEPLAEAARQARLEHWPSGLLYGVYGLRVPNFPVGDGTLEFKFSKINNFIQSNIINSNEQSGDFVNG
jgi:hypothetical protein